MANQTRVLPNSDSIVITLATTPITRTMTETVEHGLTIKSPDAYYVYSKIRIMTANAVADAAGNVVCVADSIKGSSVAVKTSTFDSVVTSVPYTTRYVTTTIYESVGDLVTPVSTITTTVVDSSAVESSFVSTWTTDDRVTYQGVNTKLGQYFLKGATVTQEGTEIALATPFLYKPERGNVPVLGDQDYVPDYNNCNPSGPPLSNYGYPPQQVCAIKMHFKFHVK